MQLKENDKIQWQYGYKLYESRGAFEVDIEDIGSGEMRGIVFSGIETQAKFSYEIA